MAKRRQSAESNLPLFDLPLHSGGEEQESAALPDPPPATPASAAPAAAPEKAAPAPAQPPRPAAAPRKPESSPPPEQPALFSEEDLAATEEEWPEEAHESDDPPLVQDRLLSGLADVVLLSAAIGLMVIGTLLMDVRLTLADWPPFAVFAFLLSFPYAVIPLAFWGHTPGMAWVGHTARSLAGEPLTFGQTVRRWLGALLTLALAGLPLLLAWSGGRSLADRMSDSTTQQRP